MVYPVLILLICYFYNLLESCVALVWNRSVKFIPKVAVDKPKFVRVLPEVVLLDHLFKKQ